jgi:hypothetical protein
MADRHTRSLRFRVYPEALIGGHSEDHTDPSLDEAPGRAK